MAQERTIISAQALRENLQQFYEKPVTRVSLELLLSLTTVIFFALFALRPTLNTMSRLVREIEEKRQVDQELSKKVAALSTAQSEYFTYQDRFPVLETAVFQELSLESALIYLEYLANISGANLVGLQVRDFPVALPPLESERESAPQTDLQELSKKEIGIYATQITFEGNLDNIKRFFQAIESIRPLLAVQGFSITVREERNQAPVITVNTTLFLYGYQPRVAAPTRAGTTSAPVDEDLEGAQ